MKTSLLLTATFLLAGTAHADAIPDGTYHGNGLWKSATQRGTYDVSTTVAGLHFTSTYKLANGQTIDSSLDVQPGQNGFFRVLESGKDAGGGYCLENTVLCHFEANADKLSLEETVTIQNGKMYKFGSKTIDGVKVMWQESLEK